MSMKPGQLYRYPHNVIGDLKYIVNTTHDIQAVVVPNEFSRFTYGYLRGFERLSETNILLTDIFCDV